MARPSSLAPPLRAAPLERTLGQLAELLRGADDEKYDRSPVGHFDCSLGAQVRHVLDHVRCLVAGLDGRDLDYDQRERDTEIERSRSAALEEIARLVGGLAELEARRIDEPCAVVVHAYGGAPEAAPVPSSVGRELAFVLSHTVHHLALIGAIAAELGLRVPPRFGYAPSTLAHLEGK